MKRAALALAAILAAPQALAATVLAATVEDLARRSDAVVRALVVAQESRLTRDGRRIHTYVEVEVQQVWRGSAPARLTVRVPGGVVGDLGQRVHGAAAFVDREEVVLFLGRAAGGVHLVNGLSLGKFTVDGVSARHRADGLRQLSREVPPGERLTEEMPLVELERRVRSTK